MRCLAIVLAFSGVAACKKSTSAAEWRAYVEPKLVAAFCEPQQFFRRCFDITEGDCLAVASQSIRRCFDITTIPDPIDQKQGGETGRKVGECAGNEFETVLARTRRHDRNCDDPSAWVGR
jgi:hypothetical protein